MRVKGKNGTSIEIITQKIKRELRKEYPTIGKHDKKDKVRNRFKSGSLTVKDWNNIEVGMRFIRDIIMGKFNTAKLKQSAGMEDISKLQFIVSEYETLSNKFFNKIISSIRLEKNLQEKIQNLSDYSQIAQAARDGIILKKEVRDEKIDGKIEKVEYDTVMTPNEVIWTLKKYQRMLDRVYADRFDNYLGLGLAISGILGVAVGGEKNGFKKNVPFITLEIASQAGKEVLREIISKKMGETQKDEIAWNLNKQQKNLENDLLENEQVSSSAEKISIGEIKRSAKAEKRVLSEKENYELIFSIMSDSISAIMTGAYVGNNVKIKENGKIDGKSLASVIVSLRENKKIANTIYFKSRRLVKNNKREEGFESVCEDVFNIISQMEEKVYPLEGAKNSFDSLEIKDLDASFYPKKDYKTGEIKFSTNIKIPEFSMKRGDVVLLSGASGAGKSTFLRLLKRGDINNRNAIKLSTGERVDNLGTEFISFRPSMDLGSETTVLHQITGKRNISDLNKNERKKLIHIMNELHLDFPDLMEQLATRKFAEFSTGQQRRLILSKMFYRIDDGASVIIVDEPVGNVEDKLIKEQLEMIKRYALRKNVMLLLTTHRLDLAEKLSTKRYHINENGVMEQMEIKSKEKEYNF